MSNCAGTQRRLAALWLGSFTGQRSHPHMQACYVILAGLLYLGTCVRLWTHLATGEKRNDGSATTVQCVDQHLQWLNWPIEIRGVAGSFLAVAAARAGGISEPDARFANPKTISGSRF